MQNAQFWTASVLIGAAAADEQPEAEPAQIESSLLLSLSRGLVGFVRRRLGTGRRGRCGGA
jgi:hypothetical protein